MKSILLALVAVIGFSTTSNAAMLANFTVVPDGGSSLILLALGATGVAFAARKLGR